MSEVHPVPSQFKDQKGNVKMQDVGKLMVQGWTEAKNISLNRTTINGLVDAYGTDSAGWVGKVVTVLTMKTLVSGQFKTVLYLLPEGYELGEDGGFPVIVKKGGEAEVQVDDIPF